ncbi:IS66-like element accessory protein TnpA [Bradyrhizobium altum]|uniref:IS66-like element accessory protein TnpA n=1 Tax=Bradyrhizobium altum TaxID=1571202 RepID=UPI0035E28A30
METGRRRSWRSVEKLRIVEESFAGPRLVSATARRYGISRQLLVNWRKALASNHGAGEGSSGPTFVPAIVVLSTPPTTEAVEAGQIEIVSAKGLRVVFGPGVDVEAVVRIVRGLERRSSRSRRACWCGWRRATWIGQCSRFCLTSACVFRAVAHARSVALSSRFALSSSPIGQSGVFRSEFKRGAPTKLRPTAPRVGRRGKLQCF